MFLTSSADLYALVRFLQFRPFNDWKEFNERIVILFIFIFFTYTYPYNVLGTCAKEATRPRRYVSYSYLYLSSTLIASHVPVKSGQRAQLLLKKCLLRRTKDTKLEGKPILQLPPKHIEVVEIDFSPDEREVSFFSHKYLYVPGHLMDD